MWGLWFFPLVKLSFYVGLAGAVLWYLLRARAAKRPTTPVAVTVVVAAPVGCAALPVITMAFLAAVAPLFQKSDTRLYQEVFGHQPAIGEDRMLFDYFGGGADREIFMRAEPTRAERDQMLAAAPLRSSELTVNDFVALGARHSFSWWLSTDPHRDDRCTSVRIREAHGFRGWREFRVAECLDGGTDFPDDMYMRYLYVVASGR